MQGLLDDVLVAELDVECLKQDLFAHLVVLAQLVQLSRQLAELFILRNQRCVRLLEFLEFSILLLQLLLELLVLVGELLDAANELFLARSTCCSVRELVKQCNFTLSAISIRFGVIVAGMVENLATGAAKETTRGCSLLLLFQVNLAAGAFAHVAGFLWLVSEAEKD